MKKIFFVLPPLFLTLIFATCRKSPTPDNDYPYFQCKINRQTYIPNNCANCITCAILGDTTFLLGGNAGFQAVDIGIIKLDKVPISKTSYILDNNLQQNATYDISPLVNDIYKTDAIHTGKLTINTLDRTKKIIEGSFYFKAYNAYRNDSVSITDGKFRLNYTTN
jgi:hypothetical protein